MLNSNLIIIAGCNGSGKSSFSQTIVTSSIPFDYDKIFLNFYHSITDFDLKDVMAHNMARQKLEKTISQSIESTKDFSYETNFNSTPFYWPNKFKAAGYKIHIVFFCLDSVDEAKKRVAIRVENGGHHVPDNEIVSRFHLGYSHLDDNYSYFDSILLFDTSQHSKPPSPILYMDKSEKSSFQKTPRFIEEKLPKLISYFND